MLIPRPTNESQPSASDIATASGTSVSDSSSTPTTDDIIMHTKTMTANRRYFFFSNFLTTEDMIYLSTPASSIMTSRSAVMPNTVFLSIWIPVPFFSVCTADSAGAVFCFFIFRSPCLTVGSFRPGIVALYSSNAYLSSIFEYLCKRIFFASTVFFCNFFQINQKLFFVLFLYSPPVSDNI